MSSRTILAAAVLAGAFIVASGAETRDRIGSVDVEGTAFRIRLGSGRVLSGHELVGATLSLAASSRSTPKKILIDTVLVDPIDPDGETVLYHFLAVDRETQQRQELCGSNAQGERWGFAVRGQWDAEGRHLSDLGYTLTCADGAQGKCVRWGYKPWKTMADGTRLDAYHQACIRLVRADYCGGRGTTRDGMLIDVYDDIGIQAPDAKAVDAGVRFEAAWTPAGAACVAHTRVPENVTLEQLAAQCPRLAGRLGEASCTEKSAARLPGGPVLLFNRSR
jgi:hypothetical protein